MESSKLQERLHKLADSRCSHCGVLATPDTILDGNWIYSVNHECWYHDCRNIARVYHTVIEVPRAQLVIEETTCCGKAEDAADWKHRKIIELESEIADLNSKAAELKAELRQSSKLAEEVTSFNEADHLREQIRQLSVEVSSRSAFIQKIKEVVTDARKKGKSYSSMKILAEMLDIPDYCTYCGQVKCKFESKCSGEKSAYNPDLGEDEELDDD